MAGGRKRPQGQHALLTHKTPALLGHDTARSNRPERVREARRKDVRVKNSKIASHGRPHRQRRGGLRTQMDFGSPTGQLVYTMLDGTKRVSRSPQDGVYEATITGP